MFTERCKLARMRRKDIDSEDSSLRKRFRRMRKGDPKSFSLDHVVLKSREEIEEKNRGSTCGAMLTDVGYNVQLSCSFMDFRGIVRKAWEAEQHHRLIEFSGQRVVEDDFREDSICTRHRLDSYRFKEVILAAPEDVDAMLEMISVYGDIWRDSTPKNEVSCCTVPSLPLNSATRYGVPGEVVFEYISGLEKRMPFEAYIHQCRDTVSGPDVKLHRNQSVELAYEVRNADMHAVFDRRGRTDLWKKAA